MKTVHIKKLDKYHPGYKDRDLKWCKTYFSMINSDPEFELLCEVDRWRYVAFIMLELQLKRPVPLDKSYLIRKGFDFKKRPIELTLKMLQKFVEVIDIPLQSDTVTPPLHHVTESGTIRYLDKELDKEKELDTEQSYVVDFVSVWNGKPSIPKVLLPLSDSRAEKLRVRFKDPLFSTRWTEIIDRIADSPFCTGASESKWKATIDWVIENDTNFVKVLEGKYDSRNKLDEVERFTQSLGRKR